jgi:two-component system chemotaxis sensor kinase CheA
VEVVVADDGSGFDLEALREQVRRKGLPEPADDRDLAHMVFLPGFSTSKIITNISGRGVGLDVVKSRVESLHGTIDLAFTAGRGTRFTLALPLTLTTLRAMLLRAGGQTFALATTNVHKLVRIGPENFRSVEGREVVVLDPPVLGGAPLPVVSLAETIGLPHDASKGLTAKTPGLIVTTGEKRMVFIVDELLAEQEIVVKNLGARIRRVRNISGATILPSGQIALVLNAAHLVRTAMTRAPGSSLATAKAAAPTGKAPKRRRRVLVVDDSVTTRTLEKSILDAAGYEVLTAVDGEAGWQMLLEQGADLLVSDVEMPRMDGFALTETVRKSKKFAELPIILFTSRGTEQDKARGIEVGADAYIVKGDFDQKDLIETIAQLL